MSRTPAQVHRSSPAARGASMAEAMELGSVSRGFRAMFSMLSPNESSFEKVEDVPPYVQQVGAASHRRDDDDDEA